MPKKTIFAFALLALGSLASRAEQIAALGESEIPSVAAITGFHSLTDKEHALSFRLVEADSVDVAKNPVTLFLVITNDGGGPDEQGHVWRLPGVARVTHFSLIKSGVQISAKVDGMVDEQTGRLSEHGETLSVSYAFAKGQSSDQIRIKTSRP